MPRKIQNCCWKYLWTSPPTDGFDECLAFTRAFIHVTLLKSLRIVYKRWRASSTRQDFRPALILLSCASLHFEKMLSVREQESEMFTEVAAG